MKKKHPMHRKCINSVVFPIDNHTEFLIKIGELGFGYCERTNYTAENVNQAQSISEKFAITYQENNFPTDNLDLDIKDPHTHYAVGKEFDLSEALYQDFKTLLSCGYIDAAHIKTYHRYSLKKAPVGAAQQYDLHYMVYETIKTLSYELQEYK